jgi:predicted GIY-YIG superfamily endonuclease
MFMFYVRSINSPDKNYTGYTTNVEMRLSVHNSGRSKATQLYRPWELVAYIVF